MPAPRTAREKLIDAAREAERMAMDVTEKIRSEMHTARSELQSLEALLEATEILEEDKLSSVNATIQRGGYRIDGVGKLSLRALFGPDAPAAIRTRIEQTRSEVSRLTRKLASQLASEAEASVQASELYTEMSEKSE